MKQPSPRAASDFLIKRSTHAVAAVAAEFDTRSDRSLAGGAIGGLGRQVEAAIGAEFSSAGGGVAARAGDDLLAGKVYTTDHIGIHGFLLDLVAESVRFGGFDFAFAFGGAIGAETGFVIEANIFADPGAAALALHEKGFKFGNGLGEGIVVSFATGQAVEFVGTGAGPAKNAAQHVAEATRRFANHTHFVRTELAHEAVTTAVAKKLELKAHVGAMVGIISSELYVGHLNFS